MTVMPPALPGRFVPAHGMQRALVRLEGGELIERRCCVGAVTTMTRRCKSCPASIIFVHTRTGAPMPLDPMPAAGGNVRVVDGVAHVVGATIDMLDPTDDGTRYMPHFATCPSAAEWA